MKLRQFTILLLLLIGLCALVAWKGQVSTTYTVFLLEVSGPEERIQRSWQTIGEPQPTIGSTFRLFMADGKTSEDITLCTLTKFRNVKNP